MKCFLKVFVTYIFILPVFALLIPAVLLSLFLGFLMLPLTVCQNTKFDFDHWMLHRSPLAYMFQFFDWWKNL